MLRSSRFGGSGLLALLAVAYLSKSSPIPLPRPRGSLLQSQQHLRALDDMAGAGSNGEALASRMEIIEMIIEMNGKLRSRQEIVNGLSIFLEENGIEEETSLEELEEESDVFEEEESEGLREDGPKEAHDNVRTSHKVSLRSITSMTDEERFNMRIKKFGMNTSKEFRKSPGASCFGLRLSTGMDCHHFQFGTSAGKENADMLMLVKFRNLIETGGHLQKPCSRAHGCNLRARKAKAGGKTSRPHRKEEKTFGAFPTPVTQSCIFSPIEDPN